MKSCQDQCNLGCEYVSCNKNFTQNQQNFFNETYGMCLPKGLNTSEYSDRCNSYEQTDLIIEKDECESFVPRIIAETKKIHFFLIILAIILIIFALSLIIYRWRVFYLKLSFLCQNLILVKCDWQTPISCLQMLPRDLVSSFDTKFGE